MNHFYKNERARFLPIFGFLVLVCLLNNNAAMAQSCPSSGTSSITTYPNTYYPATTASAAAGSKTITLGAVAFGTTPIASGDVLLVIQMQGTQIDSLNSNVYGSGAGTGNGYLNNASMLAGNMEFVVAKSSVPTTGGTLTLLNPLVNSYINSAAGSEGQYTYQIIRVPLYYNLTLGASITAPAWGVNSGSLYSGGVVVLFATNTINMNSNTVSAAGMGFRGGGGVKWNGNGSSTTLSWTDYVSSSTLTANASKGEGISGTPKYSTNYLNTRTTLFVEGYPKGSCGQGAPGNAGGGGTDGDPANNDQNSGGGGGSNGGPGGRGGDAWSSADVSGGQPGAIFAQASPSRFVMGGGGGAGTNNDGTGTPGNGVASSGAPGGGIVIMIANTITGPGTIDVSGAAGNATVQNDAAGGGGAGGSVLIMSAAGSLTNIIVKANGGAGGINEAGGGPEHGPGGGGGGGVIYSSSPLSASSSSVGGVPGTTAGGTSTYGATTGTTGSVTQNTTQSQIPQFPITCVILPVDFIFVTAQKQDNLATISWGVSGEAATLGYEVEKSTDGVNFVTIGSVPYKLSDGNINTYDYKDNNTFASNGSVYYRIKENEISGEYSYSKIVSLQVSGNSGKLTVFPNPASGSAFVTFNATTPGNISLRMFDQRGGLIWQRQYNATIGPNTVQIDNISALAKGIYILQWSDGQNSGQTKLLVN
jgi:Secretion system C-terminal sorting domain